MEIIENRENELRLETGIALGKICKIIKTKVIQYLDDYTQSVISLLTIVKYIENEIGNSELLRDNKFNPIAFPVGVSLNNVCAHDTCISDSDSRVFKLETELIKIDFGVQMNGIIIDNAISYSRNPKYLDLINASKHMVSVVIENIKKGDRIWDIQKKAEEALLNFNENKGTNFVAISNLAGHQIDKYQIHADQMQLIYPNCLVNNDKITEIKGDSFYAIEFFVSDGDEKFPVMETDKNKNSHFMVNKTKLAKLTKMKIHNIDFDKIRNIIVDNFGTLAFCQRFIANKLTLSGDKYTIINEALEWLFGLGILAKYPPVLDTNPAVAVSQFEETIYIPNSRNKNTIVLS